MRYVAVVEKNPRLTPDVEMRDFVTWPQVTHFLRYELDNNTIRVRVSKFSSDHRQLGNIIVTMSNLCEVCLSLRDKILKTT